METITKMQKISWGIMLLMLIFCGWVLYQDSPGKGWYWQEQDLCAGWTFTSEQDLLSGYLCMPKEGSVANCTILDDFTKNNLYDNKYKNTIVKQCTCKRDNEPFNLYCDKKAKLKKFVGYDPTDADLEMAKNYTITKINKMVIKNETKK